MRRVITLLATALAVGGTAFSISAGVTDARLDWPAYNGGPGGEHWSPLKQINATNVGALQMAWHFDGPEGALQTNPLIVENRLFAFTVTLQVVALDAATGKRQWLFDTGVVSRQPSRGFAWWQQGKEKRLFAAIGSRLYALDPDTGRPMSQFGEGGSIDIGGGLRSNSTGYTTVMTSPGVIWRDMIIVGFRTGESKPAAPGAIRAFDVRTGKLRWTFRTIPAPGEAGSETWPQDAWKHAGGANAWAGMVIDMKRGIVYAPTGSAVNDFYGDDRHGNNLYANSLLAINATSGKLLWHFQEVHHDLWDRDLPSPPVLVTIKRKGKLIDAVAQTSKQGYVFVFDRVSGKPLFPIEERPYPASDVPGEQASPTQPFPLAPEPFARQRLTADMLTQRTPEAHAWAQQAFASFRSEGQFVPMSIDRQTVVFPGFDGGAEWGGPAVDPKRSILYVNSNDVAWTGGLTSGALETTHGPGSELYQTQCSACHGSDRKGALPEFPSLVEVGKRFSAAEISQIVHEGRGRMPAFPAIAGASQTALVEYLRTGKEVVVATDSGSKRELESTGMAETPARYRFSGYRKFLDPDGYPAVQPPWGTLSAIDLNSGRYLWKVPLGEYPELVAKGMMNTGSENYGGPIATAGNILIIGATIHDSKIRAFDSRTGKLLWEGKLPFPGNATPATYMVNGRQFVVIATSSQQRATFSMSGAYLDTKIIKAAVTPAVLQAYGKTITDPTSDSLLTTAAPKLKIIGGIYWEMGALSVNARETYYSKAVEYINNGLAVNKTQVDATGITDLEVGYKLSAALKISVGAQNLFDKKPNSAKLINGALSDGGIVLNAPYTYGPYGIDGGYWYARLDVTF